MSIFIKIRIFLGLIKKKKKLEVFLIIIVLTRLLEKHLRIILKSAFICTYFLPNITTCFLQKLQDNK